MRHGRALSIGVLIGVIGCSHGHPGSPGAGPPDSGAPDASPPDASAPDASPPDAAPSMVTGRRHTRCHQLSGDVDIPTDDLSRFVVQALIPDDSPTGYRIQDGTGRADGSFTIPGVPDGVTYLLRIGTGYYVTDQRVLDLQFEQIGRCVPPPAVASLATPVSFQLAGMAPFTTTDNLEVRSLLAGVEQFLGTTVKPGDTAVHETLNWDTGAALPDASAGDDLQVFHRRLEDIPSDHGRTVLRDRILDQASFTGVRLQDGVAATIDGSFQPVTTNRTIAISLDRAAYDAGYDDTSRASATVLTVSASPVPLAASDTALAVLGSHLVDYVLFDLSRSTSLVQTLSADAYGDPFPASWPRILQIDYQRTRTMAAPGSTTPDELHFGFGTRQHVALTSAVDPPPPMTPPTGIRLAGAAFSAGGKIMFDGHSPVEIEWNPVAGASSYRLDVEVWAIDPEFPEAGLVVNPGAAFRTADTSLRLPASVFTAESFYLFKLQAIQASNDYRGGHLIPPPAPPQTATVPSGRFRFTATCGDGIMQPGEDCDDGGETAHCNIDCTVAVCGDGLYNATAGEACDEGTDTLDCNRSCTRPRCGDDQINRALEDCDDGNATDDGNGCSADCKFNNVCGNHIVERLKESCDEGGVDTPTCDSDCTPVQCGDGHVNAAAGEECDDGFGRNGTGRCSKTCKLQ